MDPIKRMAIQFSYDFNSLGYTLEKIDSALNSKLINISKSNEKLRFLSYLRDIAETQYKKHAPNCGNPETCGTNKYLENVLYSINQQYDLYIEIDDYINIEERPAMQFFTEGQYFDAFSAIMEIIKKAEVSIVLVDNYVNADTLAFFPAKEPSIKLRLLTKSKCINTEFKRAIDLYNKQYENLKVETSNNFHDRFLILDDKLFYHIGASIKDAGNKTFMFSNILDEDVINTIREKISIEWLNIYE